tara:strand:- start:722 stop:1513 length:792 start_codon:yes stop_codon:yes gene_type:complete
MTKKKNCMFLGYSRNETNLIKIIETEGWTVKNYKNKIKSDKLFLKYDCIISFGYREIIPYEILNKIKKPIINLHISFLPYNKGANPNVWSFLEDTPSGVSIHEINNNIDGGPIIYKKFINFKNLNISFNDSYIVLKKEIEKLFIENLNNILNYKYKKEKQINKGTIHYKSDLALLKEKKIFKSYKEPIIKVKKRYVEYLNKLQSEKLAIINQIENTRSKNNINWMDLLRNSYLNSPKETMKILKNINTDDLKISNLFKKLTKY